MESHGGDLDDALGNDDGSQAEAISEETCLHDAHVRRNVRAHKRLAITECGIADVGNAFGDGYRLKATAPRERSRTDALQTLRKIRLSKRSAILKCAIANGGHAGGNRDRDHVRTVAERAVADARHAIGNYHVRRVVEDDFGQTAIPNREFRLRISCENRHRQQRGQSHSVLRIDRKESHRAIDVRV